MPRKRFTPEQIITHLREAEVLLSQGKSVGEVCRQLNVSENTYYRWRREYGGLEIDQAKRLKELEKENERRKKLVAEQALDNAILKEAARGNFSARYVDVEPSSTSARGWQLVSGGRAGFWSNHARASDT